MPITNSDRSRGDTSWRSAAGTLPTGTKTRVVLGTSLSCSMRRARALARIPGGRRKRFLVADDFDHHGPIHAERARDRLLELARLLDANADAAERFRGLC